MDENLILQRFRRQLYWFLSPKSKFLEEYDGQHAAREFAEFLSSVYEREMLSYGSRTTGYRQLIVKDFQPLPSRTRFLEPLYKFIENLKSHCADDFLAFWIHGSLSSDDYVVGWSDFDTFCIIKDSVILDPLRLLNLRNKMIESYDFMLEIDPLQHHGILLCTERDLLGYDNAIMPTEVLQTSSMVIGDKVNFFLRPQHTPTQNIVKLCNLLRDSCVSGEFKHHALNGEYLKNNYKNINCMYQLKNFISLINIIPTYFLNDLNIFCLKKNSFNMINDYELKNLEIIECASRVRGLWSLHEIHPFRGNRVPDWVCEVFGYSYFERTYNLLEEMNKIISDHRND